MTIIAIGGAEEKAGDMPVLKRVLSETGKAAPRVMVITTATGYPEEVGENYKNAFGLLGVMPDVRHVTDAAGASDEGLIAAMRAADVVFFSGGDQSRLSAVFGNSPFLAALKVRGDDVVIAGTSAGAAAMSSLMITGGDPADAAQPGWLSLGEGLGFTPGIVFDTHFNERGRLPRLFGAAAADNRKAGVGLDENTAIVLKSGTAEVVGSGEVTVVTEGAVRRYRSGDAFKI